jgi:uncharacterized short protein YbdD (DUF466 family)
MGTRLTGGLRLLWRVIRQLSGDDAYERYLAHHTACHAETAPLSRKEYFQRQQQQKWSGIKRCC